MALSTMSDLIAQLVDLGLVTEEAALPGPGAGRPIIPVRLHSPGLLGLGVHVDVDGVHVASTQLDGTPGLGTSAPANLLRASPQRVVRAIRRALRDLLTVLDPDAQIVAIEISVPGTVARDIGVVGLSVPFAWVDVPIEEMVRPVLEELGLGECWLGIDNDINHAALGAIRDEHPIPRGATALYVGAERGVGGAVVVNGTVYRGAHGGAGEVGHISIESPGRACPCGRRGCMETRVSLVNLLVDADLASPQEASAMVASNPSGAVDMIQAALVRDRHTRSTVRRAGKALGRALDFSVGLLNPQYVLVGGYLPRLGAVFTDPVRHVLAPTLAIAPFRSTQIIMLGGRPERTRRGAALTAADIALSAPLQILNGRAN